MIVTGIDGAGSLRMDVLKDSCSDKAGNKGLGFMDGMSHTVGLPELLSLTARGSTLTSGAAVVFDVRFSEAVIGLDATDFVLIADDTATATLSLVANDATSYILTIDTIARRMACDWFAIASKGRTRTLKVIMASLMK